MLCFYALTFALLSVASVFLGKVFCVISSAVLLMALIVTPFITLRHGISTFRNVTVGLLFALSAVVIAYFITLPQLDDAREYDGKYITAEGVVDSVKLSPLYTVAVVDCDVVNGRGSSQKISIITRNEYYDGIDLGMRVSFGGMAEFDASFYNKGNQCFLTVFPSYCELCGTDGILGGFIYSTRSKIRKAVDEMESSHLLKALIMGDKSGITDEIYDDFKRLGTSHLLAISGLHLAIVVMTFYGLIAKIGVPNKLASLISILLALFYMLIAGSALSAVRATQMLTVFFLAKFIRRKNDGITSLCFAGFVILAISQWSMFNVGFLLSFFATFGILTFVRPISRAYRKHYFDKMEFGIKYTRSQEKLHRFIDIILSSSATTVAATVCTLPIVLLTFNEVSTFAIIGNLVSLPIAKYYLISSFASVLLQCVGLGLIALPLTVLSEALGRVLLFVTDLLSKISPDTVSVRPYYITVGAVITVVIILIFILLSRNWRSLPILTVILILFIPTFNLISDGLINDVAIIDTVSRRGANTSLVRWRGQTYLLDHTSSNSQKLGDIDDLMEKDHITHVDKAVFIADDDIVDRVSAILTLVEVDEITVMSDVETDFSNLARLCASEGVALNISCTSQLTVADGITAYCFSDSITAFFVENGSSTFSSCRLFSEEEYVRRLLEADVTVFEGKFLPKGISTHPDGHYRLHA